MDSEILLSELRAIARQTGDRTDSLQQVANVIRNRGNYRWVGLYDVNHGAGSVCNVVYSGPGAPNYPIFPVTKGLTGDAIRTRRTVNCADVSTDSRYLTAFGSTQSEIIVPIFDGEGKQVIGTIDIESEQKNAFDPDTQRLLEACSKEIAPIWQRFP